MLCQFKSSCFCFFGSTRSGAFNAFVAACLRSESGFVEEIHRLDPLCVFLEEMLLKFMGVVDTPMFRHVLDRWKLA